VVAFLSFFFSPPRGPAAGVDILANTPSAESTALRTGGPPVPKRRFHVQWVHIGMQGPGVCIRKISGFVKVTSGSRRTKVRSQIFYVRTSEGHALPYRGFQLPPCPGALSVSALRAGALALTPTCTGLRAGRGARTARPPVRALPRSRGAVGPLFKGEALRLLDESVGRRFVGFGADLANCQIAEERGLWLANGRPLRSHERPRALSAAAHSLRGR